ncbi:MFS transporter [Nonomuraea sp. NPDC050556]|uniref:MFS transporter n=1 Tax=Nonomuraea sp. NPDC050556 TaxID=3364369 RepID=UPI00379F9ECE
MRRTLIAALLGFFLIILDASAVNIGLDAIGAGLQGGMTWLQWVVDGYTLMFAALMLSAGALSDRIGASRAFAIGLAAFTLASVACGLAPTLPLLVAARVVQGAAAALTMPASLALVRQAYTDPAKRARAISIWTAGGAAAVAAGPVAGGLLTDVWSWRGIFLINVPVGALAWWLLRRTPASERRAAPLDLPGQVTATVALAALTFAVIERNVLAAVVAMAAGAAFVLVESRVARPVVPLSLFRSRAVTTSIAAGFALNVGFYGMVFLLGLYFQQVKGMSPLAAGLMFVPMTLFITTANLLSSRIAARFGNRVPIVAGQVAMMAGLLGMVLVGRDTPVLALLMIPIGVGGGLAVPTLTAVLLDSVEPERAGLAGGLFNAIRQAGAGLAVAVFGSFTAGLTESALIGAGLLLLTAFASLRQARPRRVSAGGRRPASESAMSSASRT